MKREALEKLGITGDVQDSVLKLHGTDMEKSEQNVATLKDEIKGLKGQLGQRDTDLSGLKKKLEDSGNSTEALSQLQTKYEADTSKLQNELKQNKLDGAIDLKLVGAKVRNVKAARALLNQDELKLTDDGGVEGLDDQLAALEKSDGYLFDNGTKTQYQPHTGGEEKPDLVSAMVDAFKGGMK